LPPPLFTISQSINLEEELERIDPLVGGSGAWSTNASQKAEMGKIGQLNDTKYLGSMSDKNVNSMVFDLGIQLEVSAIR